MSQERRYWITLLLLTLTFLSGTGHWAHYHYDRTTERQQEDKQQRETFRGRQPEPLGPITSAQRAQRLVEIIERTRREGINPVRKHFDILEGWTPPSDWQPPDNWTPPE